MMATPQGGNFDEDSVHHQYLEYAVGAPDADRIVTALANACADAWELGESLGTRVVVAFGADLWRRIAPGAAPDGLRSFAAIEGLNGTRAPATQRDVLF
jgi:deferrochelatase/peroxidase EfeB